MVFKNERVPLTIYVEEGVSKVVGDAKVNSDGSIDATVTDPDTVNALRSSVDGYSIRDNSIGVD